MLKKRNPELNHFTEKYQGQQATYIKARGYVLQTANFTNSIAEKSNVEIKIETDDTSGESNNIEVTETTNDSNNTKNPPVE